jgi:FHA domain
MIKCPFCHFENEDGALFCERCTSDLSSVAPAPRGAPPPPVLVEAIPIPSDAVFAEAIPLAIAEPLEVMPLDTAEQVNIPSLQLDPIPMVPVPPPPAPEPVPDLPLAHAEPVPELEAIADVEPPAPAPAPTPAPAPAPAPTPVAADAAPGALPAGAQPRLLVLRGQKRNVEYPIYEGLNFIGRADEKPVDIDLEEQEPPDRIWCSRQHACIAFENDQLLIEDLNSANGTYVNRTRVYPGQKRPLAINDIVQIGNVQLKVLA